MLNLLVHQHLSENVIMWDSTSLHTELATVMIVDGWNLIGARDVA